MNFNCLKEEGYHNVYKLQNVKTKEKLIDHLEIHFLELEKYDDKLSTLMDRWINFLKRADQYSKNKLPKALEEVPEIKKAIEVLEIMHLTEEEQEIYEGRLKWMRDEELALVYAEQKGIEKGRKEGMEKGIEKGIEKGMEKGKLEIAKEALSQGLSTEMISKITGLTIEQIEKLKGLNLP